MIGKDFLPGGVYFCVLHGILFKLFIFFLCTEFIYHISEIVVFNSSTLESLSNILKNWEYQFRYACIAYFSTWSFQPELKQLCKSCGMFCHLSDNLLAWIYVRQHLDGRRQLVKMHKTLLRKKSNNLQYTRCPKGRMWLLYLPPTLYIHICELNTWGVFLCGFARQYVQVVSWANLYYFTTHLFLLIASLSFVIHCWRKMKFFFLICNLYWISMQKIFYAPAELLTLKADVTSALFPCALPAK